MNWPNLIHTPIARLADRLLAMLPPPLPPLGDPDAHTDPPVQAGNVSTPPPIDRPPVATSIDVFKDSCSLHAAYWLAKPPILPPEDWEDASIVPPPGYADPRPAIVPTVLGTGESLVPLEAPIPARFDDPAPEPARPVRPDAVDLSREGHGTPLRLIVEHEPASDGEEDCAR